MGENSNIEWTTHTFNPWIGCTKISDGCKNCYAETLMDKRYGRVMWGKGNPRQHTSAANWKKPLEWNRNAEANWMSYLSELPLYDEGELAPYEAPRVFCASLADVFDAEVPDEWRDELFALIAQTPYLKWLILTKRPEEAARYFAVPLNGMYPEVDRAERGVRIARCAPDDRIVGAVADQFMMDGFFQNVWLGTSVEDQKAADIRIPVLLKIPAAVRFLSCEPLLGQVDLNNYLGCGWDGPGGWRNCPQYLKSRQECTGVDWVIVGGESGADARPFHIDWARLLRDQCDEARVSYFFKQHGEWLHDSQMTDQQFVAFGGRDDFDCHLWPDATMSYRINKKRAGRVLDGCEWNEMPTVAEEVA